MFNLHPTLKKDLKFIGDLTLSAVYQLPSSDNPWLVLVPKVNSITEWFELSTDQQLTLTKEVNFLAEFLKQEFAADKINIGALGNIVPQLHIHIIARFKNDKSWPGSIWGSKFNQYSNILEQTELKVKNKIKSWSN